MSLAARKLDSIGIPTLCLGSALDIVQAGAPPRSVFLDYPLGHSTGRPFDRADQDRVLRAALAAFERIEQPGAIVSLPAEWPADPHWKQHAMPADAGDTRMPRDTTPQYQTEEDRRLAEG